MAAGPRSGYRKTSHRTHAVVLAVILLAAFGVRAGVGLAWRDRVYPFGDSQTYRALGDTLALAEGLVITDSEVGPARRHADRMPGYPVVLAILRNLFGPSVIPLVLLQAALGTIAAWLACLLGREVFSPLAGLLAAAAVALAPWQVYFATVALTECWSAAMLLAVVLCAVRAVKQQQLSYAAGAGLAAAALVYVHPVFLGLPAVLLVPAAVAPGRLRWLGHWALATVIVAAALVPWWARNASVFGRFVPATTRLGVTLYDGVRPGATGGTDMRFEQDLAPRTADLDEAAYDRWYRRRSWDLIRSDPWRVVSLAGPKFRRLWSPVPHADVAQAPFYRWASILAFVPMVAGAMLGLVVLLRRPGLLVLLLAPVAWVTMVHLLMVGSVRYRVPVEPMLLVVAAAAVGWVLQGQAGTDER